MILWDELIGFDSITGPYQKSQLKCLLVCLFLVSKSCMTRTLDCLKQPFLPIFNINVSEFDSSFMYEFIGWHSYFQERHYDMLRCYSTENPPVSEAPRGKHSSFVVRLSQVHAVNSI